MREPLKVGARVVVPSADGWKVESGELVELVVRRRWREPEEVIARVRLADGLVVECAASAVDPSGARAVIAAGTVCGRCRAVYPEQHALWCVADWHGPSRPGG